MFSCDQIGPGEGTFMATQNVRVSTGLSLTLFDAHIEVAALRPRAWLKLDLN